MKKNINICFSCILMHVLMICVSFSQSENILTPEQWKQDIEFYFNGLEKVHVNPYHKTSKVEFQKIKAEFLHRVPSMTDNQIFTEIMRLTALIGDGHSAVNIFGFHGSKNNSAFNFHIFPLKLYLFGDGLYVTKAAPEYSSLEGQRITKLNNKNIENVLDKITPYVVGDNEYSIKFNVTRYLVIAEILNGLGISDNVNSIYVTAEDDDKKKHP